MMKKTTAKMVREPVQVYLATPDRAALDRVAALAGLPRAEVVRRAIRRYAAEALSDDSPVLFFLDRAAAHDASGEPDDVAERHDDYLADWEMAAWNDSAETASTSKKRPPRARTKRTK